jgi:hypothetical protein
MMAEDNNDSDSIPEEKIFSEEAKEDHEVVARKVFFNHRFDRVSRSVRFVWMEKSTMTMKLYSAINAT